MSSVRHSPRKGGQQNINGEDKPLRNTDTGTDIMVSKTNLESPIFDGNHFNHWKVKAEYSLFKEGVWDAISNKEEGIKGKLALGALMHLVHYRVLAVLSPSSFGHQL